MCPTGKNSLAIEELGELVEGCDQQKARASNAEYQKALSQGYRPQNLMKEQNRSQKQRKSATKKADLNDDQELVGSFEGIIDPVVGEVYQAWWEAEPRSWYLVVILPYSGDGDWKEVGVTGNLFTSGLRKEIPNCFKVDKVTTGSGEGASRLTWAEGYQDGGPKVWARKFPCLFLHAPLKVPSADQEFVLGHRAEVLAFRTAQQLRHRSTKLPPGLSAIGVDAYKDLAQDFEARLRAIRAKQKSPEKEVIKDNTDVQASSTKGQQQHHSTTSAKTNGPACSDSTESNLLIPVDRHQDTLEDCYGLAARNPRVSLPSQLVNGLSGRYCSSESTDLDRRPDRSTYHSVPPTTETTYRPSPNSGEGDQSRSEPRTSGTASRQVHPVALKSQSADPQFSTLQKSSPTSQTAAPTSERPRAASAFAGESRGPTALRPFHARNRKETHVGRPPHQDRASGLRNTVNALERDAVPNGAGKTAWPSSYPEVLRQPWRNPGEGGRRPDKG